MRGFKCPLKSPPSWGKESPHVCGFKATAVACGESTPRMWIQGQHPENAQVWHRVNPTYVDTRIAFMLAM